MKNDRLYCVCVMKAAIISSVMFFCAAVASGRFADCEALSRLSVPPVAAQGKNFNFYLQANCTNLATNQFEIQFSSLPTVVASTCSFIVGFENGHWYTATNTIGKQFIIDTAVIPEGAFRLDLALQYRTTGKPLQVDAKINGISFPELANVIAQANPSLWQSARAFSRGIAGYSPRVEMVLHQTGTMFIVK